MANPIVNFILGRGTSAKKSSSVNSDDAVSKVKSVEEMTELERYKHYLVALEIKISGYRTLTIGRHDEQLDKGTRQVLVDHTGTDIVQFIYDELTNLSVLEQDFRGIEELVNSGRQSNLEEFDKQKEAIGKQVSNHLRISRLITNKVLNTGAKQSLMNLNKVSHDIYNQSIGMLIDYVKVAETGNIFFKDVCKRRDTAEIKRNATISRSKSNVSILKDK